MHLQNPDWAPAVRDAVNSLADRYRFRGKYAVTDFDNTTTIFDIEHQLAIWQLRTMAFAMEPGKIAEILATELRCDYGKQISDISAAYFHLYSDYGPFNGEMLPDDISESMRRDPWWIEFAVKMRALFSMVEASEERPAVWLLYWFTGMTEDQVYRLAYASHLYYCNATSQKWSMTSPAEISSECGQVTCSWVDGICVTDNVRELWQVLKDNGIDIWVCSASGSAQVRAALDAFGLHELCSGLYGVNIRLDENGCYLPEFDDKGCWYISEKDGGWKRDDVPVGSMSKGPGKVAAILNALVPRYGEGPVAGFMDSSGDYEFCTEFSSMKLVVCYNRVLPPTDGGGVISALALYQAEVLGYDLEKAEVSGDTLYVLQGRDENGKRTLIPSSGTVLLGETEAQILNPGTHVLLESFRAEIPSTKQIIDSECPVKISEDDPASGFIGYHEL